MGTLQKNGKKGSVHFETLGNGSQRLRWTFNGKRQSEPFSSLERVKEIEYLITAGVNPKKSLGSSLGISDVDEIMNQWLDWKARSVAQTTMDGYKALIGRVLAKLPHKTIENPNAIKRWVVTHCTKSTAKRFLTYLNAACQELNGKSEFQGMASEIRENWQDNPTPRYLTEDEIEDGLASCPAHCAFYYQFMLFTGCRIGEANGLQLGDMDGKVITFQRQVQRTKKGYKVIQGLKTQKLRKFPINEELRAFLYFASEQLKHGSTNDDQWFFTDPKGERITYQSMKYHWGKHLPADTTMYNCRDTFITNQLKKGIPASIIAAWVGNSTRVIEHHYQDDSAFLDIMPK